MARIAAGLVAAVSVLAATLAAAPVAAQPWAGAAALGVEVKGGGSPVAGASVELYYLPDSQRGGPPAVTTDARGEAEIYGLAEGRWFVRVRHPRFLTYEAEVVVSASRKPQEGLVARRKEGDSLETSKVRFTKLEGRAAATTRSARAAEPPPADAPPAADRPAPAADPGAERSAAPAPAPAPPAAPTVADRPAALRILRSPHDGSCLDCQPGEWAATAWGAERAGRSEGAPCSNLRGFASTLAAELGELGGYAGPLLEPGTDEPLSRLGGKVESTLRRLVAPFADTRCQVLAMRLPPGAQFRGFQLEAVVDGGPVPCQPAAECPSGAGAWTAPPVVERTDTGTIVVAGFESRTATELVQPRLTVYFVPRSDWRPVL